MHAAAATADAEVVMQTLSESSSDDGFTDVTSDVASDVSDGPVWFMHPISGVEENGPQPDVEMPDGWMGIFNATPHAAVDTSYTAECSADEPDDERDDLAELGTSSASKIKEDTPGRGETSPKQSASNNTTRKPGVDGFTPTEVNLICHNLGIPLSELAAFATPNPDRTRTCLMPMAEVDLLIKNSGFVCKNLGLDAEQVLELSSDAHDVGELGLLSKDKVDWLCDRMGIHFEDMLYLTGEDTDLQLLKLIKEGRKLAPEGLHGENIPQTETSTPKLDALKRLMPFST